MGENTIVIGHPNRATFEQIDKLLHRATGNFLIEVPCNAELITVQGIQVTIGGAMISNIQLKKHIKEALKVSRDKKCKLIGLINYDNKRNTDLITALSNFDPKKCEIKFFDVLDVDQNSAVTVSILNKLGEELFVPAYFGSQRYMEAVQKITEAQIHNKELVLMPAGNRNNYPNDNLLYYATYTKIETDEISIIEQNINDKDESIIHTVKGHTVPARLTDYQKEAIKYLQSQNVAIDVQFAPIYGELNCKFITIC
jgi:hypothetical protein